MAKISGEILHCFHNKELDEFYVSVSLKNLAESMIKIFIPVYLFILGFSISKIALFFVFFYAIVPLFYPITLSVVSKIGVKKMMAIGTFSYIVAYFLLGMLKDGTISFYIPALAFAISISLYYSGYHIEFSHALSKKEEGTEYGILKALMIITTALGPIAGALIISFFSFQTSFYVATFLLFLSTIPLFFTRDYCPKPPKISIKSILKADKKEKGIVYQVDGFINTVSNIFWPLFIFLILGGILKLGSIVTLTSILIALISIAIGRFSDKNESEVLTFGLFPFSFSWLIRLFFLSTMGIFFMNLFSAITGTMIEIPFYKIIYDGAKKSKNIANYFLFREINLALGRGLILLPIILTGNIVWSFILAFFVSFLYLLLKKKS